jgi:3-dehydroquinate synthetase
MDLNTEKLVERMFFDKKNQDKGITFVLPIDYGRVEIFKDLDSALVKKILK